MQICTQCNVTQEAEKRKNRVRRKKIIISLLVLDSNKEKWEREELERDNNAG